MNKKGWFDDWFDFLFTVIASFFILIFLGMILVSSTSKLNTNLKNHVNIAQDTNDFLVKERSQIEKGFYLNNLDSRYAYVKKYGSLERKIKENQELYQDDPYILGVDSDGDPIPIVG